MTNATPTRTQAERADQTRARILDAAVRQFSENGLAGARTEQIAEEAGVNKALLYYYFQGKDALYAAALESVAQGVRDASLAVFDVDASAGERFLLSALNHFDRIHTNPGFQSLMQRAIPELNQEVRENRQTLTGSAYRVNVQTPAESFVLRSGQPKMYIKTAESGNKRAHAFCPNCGTPIYAAAPRDTRTYALRVGTLTQRGQLRPSRQIWFRSAQAWVTNLRDVPHIEQQ